MGFMLRPEFRWRFMVGLATLRSADGSEDARDRLPQLPTGRAAGALGFQPLEPRMSQDGRFEPVSAGRRTSIESLGLFQQGAERDRHLLN